MIQGLERDRFSMVKVYAGTSKRELVASGLTWDDVSNVKRYPLGVMYDDFGAFIYSPILTESWKD
jgi:hypothetical protein